MYLSIILALLQGLVFCQGEYFWKPYHGAVPEDAVSANATNTMYIGIGPLAGRGDLIGEIFNGETEIFVSPNGGDVQYIQEHLLILCSDNLHGLEWVETDYRGVNSIPNKVEAGHEVNRSLLGTQYVGRALVNGVYRVGKAIGYNVEKPEDNRLYVADAVTWRELRIDNYEVLVTGKLLARSVDYYWRHYEGEVPGDAINATLAQDMYIGVGPVFKKGDYVGEVYNGDPSIFVSAASGDLHRIDEHILILCSGTVDSFYWVEANRSVLHSIPNKIEVGYELTDEAVVRYGTLYVGRALFDGIYRVGKAVGYQVGDLTYYNNLYVADAVTGTQLSSSDYEVLVYQ